MALAIREHPSAIGRTTIRVAATVRGTRPVRARLGGVAVCPS
jgi:hypothetical protein